MSCRGVLGKIFGHKFQAVYDIDEERLTPEEVQIALESIKSYNWWSYHDNQIHPDLYTTKRTTKIYRGHFCTRCGERIEDKKFEI